MVQTITPVVHGGSRKRWAVSFLLHVLGATASAAAMGALLGGIGALLGAPWGRGGMLLVAALGVIYASREILGLPVPLPELRRQVPEWWRGALGPRTSALLYGVALGPGVGTHLRHGTFAAVAAVILAGGDAAVGMIALGAFGLARAVGVSVVSNGRTSSDVSRVAERLERIGAGLAPRVANATALVAIAVIALTTSLPGRAPVTWAWPAALAAAFAWAAAAKLLRPAAWREALHAHALPAWVERAAERSIPAVEAGVAVLFLVGAIPAGATLSLVLLAAFSFELLRAQRADDGSVPCGCFGGRRRRSVRWLVTRNATLMALALGALVVGTPMPLPSPPGTAELLPATLAVIGGGLAAWLLLRAAGMAEEGRVRR